MLRNVINAAMVGNDIKFLLRDGQITTKKFATLEYPYFYSSVKIDSVLVKSCEPVNVTLFDGDQYTPMQMYKVELLTPYFKDQLVPPDTITAETRIPYLQRRLGIDSIIAYSQSVDRYAYVDIEELNGQITLIGVIAYYNGEFHEYQGFKVVEDFLRYLATNKITAILAWNGEAYDYVRLSKIIKDSDLNHGYKFWWEIMLKLDAMKLYGIYLQRTMVSLDKAGTELHLGGKLKTGKDFAQLSDDELIAYNKRDVELLRDIVETTGILQLNQRVAYQTGVAPDYISSVRMTMNLIMRQFKNNNIVVKDYSERQRVPYQGAIVDGISGMYSDVVVYDVNSMYPNIILHSDYEGPNKNTYMLLRSLIRGFLSERKRYKELYAKHKILADNINQQMYKIFANSVYGVTGSTAFPFYNAEVAAFVTAKARDINIKLRSIGASLGYKVVYGDTDSVFIAGALDKAEQLEQQFNEAIAPFELKIDKVFKRVIIGGDEFGNLKKKRYAGVTPDGEIIIKGFETVRTDWCAYARETQEQMFSMLLRENKTPAEVKAFVNERAASIRNAPLDQLLFVKSINTDYEYSVNTRALRVAKELVPDIADRLFVFVQYFIGYNGEPVAVAEGSDLNKYKDLIDYRWYVTAQIYKPANRVLTAVGAYRNSTLDSYIEQE